MVHIIWKFDILDCFLKLFLLEIWAVFDFCNVPTSGLSVKISKSLTEICLALW